MDAAFYGLTIMDLRVFICGYWARNCTPHPFNRKKKMTGREFVSRFLKGNKDLSLPKPQDVTWNHIYGLNKTDVSLIFENLDSVLQHYAFEPHQIYNCDKAGLNCLHKPLKVIAPKCKHVAFSATSREKGTTTTFLYDVSGTGHYVHT